MAGGLSSPRNAYQRPRLRLGEAVGEQSTGTLPQSARDRRPGGKIGRDAALLSVAHTLGPDLSRPEKIEPRNIPKRTLRRQEISPCIVLRGYSRLRMATQERRDQITVPLDPALRAAIERVAAAEHRTMASLVRHIVAQALETQERTAA
jgi:hypothetical protein